MVVMILYGFFFGYVDDVEFGYIVFFFLLLYLESLCLDEDFGVFLFVILFVICFCFVYDSGGYFKK